MRARGHDVCTVCHERVARGDARVHVAEHRSRGDYQRSRPWQRPLDLALRLAHVALTR